MEATIPQKTCIFAIQMTSKNTRFNFSSLFKLERKTWVSGGWARTFGTVHNLCDYMRHQERPAGCFSDWWRENKEISQKTLFSINRNILRNVFQSNPNNAASIAEHRWQCTIWAYMFAWCTFTTFSHDAINMDGDNNAQVSHHQWFDKYYNWHPDTEPTQQKVLASSLLTALIVTDTRRSSVSLLSQATVDTNMSSGYPVNIK